MWVAPEGTGPVWGNARRARDDRGAAPRRGMPLAVERLHPAPARLGRGDRAIEAIVQVLARLARRAGRADVEARARKPAPLLGVAGHQVEGRLGAALLGDADLEEDVEEAARRAADAHRLERDRQLDEITAVGVDDAPPVRAVA